MTADKRKAPAGTGAAGETGAGANVSQSHYSTSGGQRQAPSLAAALAYAARGWAVFPVGPDKAPRCPHGYKDAATDLDAIRELWRDQPAAGIGLACGASGIVAIDLDVKRGIDGIGAYEALGIVADPLISQTPSGGLHLLFADPGGMIRNSAGKLAPGVDVRADGGYIVLPPSETAGGRYTAQGDWDRKPPVLPAELVALLTAPDPEPQAPQRSPAPVLADDPGAYWLGRALATAAPGNRNETGFWLSCQMRDARLAL
ncbi:MAG: bifunctional DNA primase/polymerase, partial [Sphaerochaeta sp.]|nr:bifunctional DNA primase/polymerase [Sphaerochaeta sp.]